jgi:hypothetical protein
MGPGAATLRRELRHLLAQHVPHDYLGAFTDDPADLEIAQRFCRTLADEGLLCIAWPREYGGRGASAWEQTAVREEMWAHHEPRGAQYMGVNWVGPAIMRHGTAAQKDSHLPPIARGEVIWCQGFSEPEAGSDLASLRTRATPIQNDSDPAAPAWAVSGQKIWTSYALMAQWCFLLARTSTESRKQQGLTVFLVPMDAPGIEVRPIKAMLGPHHLNEVFFDGVRVTEDDVLGEVGQGWKVVQEVLSFERVGIARYARCERLLLAAPRVFGPPVGAGARGTTGPLGADAHPLPPRPAARLQGGGPAVRRDGDARRRRRVPDRGDEARPRQRRGPHGAPRPGVAGSPWRRGRRLVPRRGGRPLAVRAGLDGRLRQHRDAADTSREGDAQVTAAHVTTMHAHMKICSREH